MAKKKLSTRSARRAGERAAVKLTQDLDKLARLEPGGSPERPLPLESASQVEVTARGKPCPLCRGELRLEEHAAESIRGARLRVARMMCVACGGRRELWFRLSAEMLN
ncbi:hypothetical protein [Chondromyces crocatus]|uniref:Uncharacterized protein n=1 Tax=Chondromyces crocatus TaxID=52 RepID=A0A0K1E7C8_CHOCO|nr:hypothetical protein [Chondromyces crocatus]AKT36572.1 uncharacterized protein CMC5_006900 [Chondromyces crocatus]